MVVEVFYERFQLWKNFGVSISGRIWEVVTYRGLKIFIEMWGCGIGGEKGVSPPYPLHFYSECDQNLFSPLNNTAESHKQVIRIKDKITK